LEGSTTPLPRRIIAMSLKVNVSSLRCQDVQHTGGEEPFITAFAEGNILLTICLGPGHELLESKPRTSNN
jgi:hypothetical protein